MQDCRFIPVTIFFILICFVFQTAYAQQEYTVEYSRNLDFIINNSMDDLGRTRLNGIFERSKSNVPVNFMNNNNKYHVMMYEAFANNRNPDQPCREGSIIAVINGDTYTIKIVGCRNDRGIWFLEEVGAGNTESVQQVYKQSGQKGEKPALDEKRPPIEETKPEIEQTKPAIDETDELILD